MVTIPVKDFFGLQFNRDSRTVEGAHAVNIGNCLVQSDGILSAFGNSLFDYKQWVGTTYFASFRIEHVGTIHHHWVLLTNDAVFEWNTDADEWQPRFMWPQTFDELWPWSHAVVGNINYFTKKGAGLWSYDHISEIWAQVTVNVPVGLVAITESAGRLVLLGSSVVAWSEIDNGNNLTPDIDLGVGLQSLAIIGGRPLAAVHDIGGFIVYTDRGIINFLISDALTPFRWEVSDQNNFVPLNPFLVLDLDDSHLILSNSGFRIVSGAKSQPWELDAGKYFVETLFRQLPTSEPGFFRMHYSRQQQLIFVSFSGQKAVGLFDRAFIYNIKSGRWSSFDQPHTNLFNFSPPSTIFYEEVDAFFDPEGYLRVFDYSFGIEEFILTADFIQVKQEEPFPVYEYNGAVYFPARMFSWPTAPTANEGYFLLNKPTFNVSDVQLPALMAFNFPAANANSVSIAASYMVGTYDKHYNQMNSFCDVGLFRLSDDETQRREHYITTTVVFSEDQSEEEVFFEDWNVLVGEEDWLAMEGEEDWGVVLAAGDNFTVRIKGTIDGIELMDEASDVEAETYKRTQRSRHYTCYIRSMFSIVRIETKMTGDNFRVTGMDVDAIPGGFVL